MNFDNTFCKAWLRCKNGDHCHLALTENVKEIARQTGNHLWECEQRECFEAKDISSTPPLPERSGLEVINDTWGK